MEFQVQSKKILKADWSIDIQSIRKEFKDMDRDSNGTISKTEFIRAFENLHKRFESNIANY